LKRRVVVLAATCTAAASLFAAAGAAAHPVISGHQVPHVFVKHSGAAPTTADCEQAFQIACYSPAQLQKAYDLAPLYGAGLTGTGRTIVIVDSFGSPTIEHDLAQFDSDFGLPAPPSLKIITPAGAPPPFDPNDEDMVGWAGETTLDVEWAHAIAPGANILLVETPVDETEGEQGFPEIVAAENFVIDHDLGDVISQSFGATEETFQSKASLLSLRGAFKNAARHDVTVLGASGDTGPTDFMLDLENVFRTQVNSWPSSDPLVTSVGGTQLHLDAAGNRVAPDNVWNDIPIGIDASGGGGPSHVFPRPDFQAHTNTGAGHGRATPDISMSAAVDGGALVFESFPGDPGGYSIVGGTSWATPLFSGIVAIADQAAGHRLGRINPALYDRLAGRHGGAGIVDVTIGDNTFTQLDADGNAAFTVPGFEAAPDYDMASGLGTVDAAPFVAQLAKRARP
jgi:subtilase family serine protease